MVSLPAKLWNRFRRTVHAFVPRLARDDDGFVRQWLTEVEYGLYSRMDVRDRAHSILVAKVLLEAHPFATRHLMAAALLHDVGKSMLGFNPQHRILVHLSRPRGLPREPLADGLRGAMQLREHHELIGARMLREAGVAPEVAQFVEDLGRESAGDPELIQLRWADERT